MATLLPFMILENETILADCPRTPYAESPRRSCPHDSPARQRGRQPKRNDGGILSATFFGWRLADYRECTPIVRQSRIPGSARNLHRRTRRRLGKGYRRCPPTASARFHADRP